MSDAMRAVGDNEPVMTDWKQYKESPEYANTRKWAQLAHHVDGSLWAAFSAGHEQAHRRGQIEALEWARTASITETNLRLAELKAGK